MDIDEELLSSNEQQRDIQDEKEQTPYIAPKKIKEMILALW